jgi:hypothetical protein
MPKVRPSTRHISGIGPVGAQGFGPMGFSAFYTSAKTCSGRVGGSGGRGRCGVGGVYLRRGVWVGAGYTRFTNCLRTRATYATALNGHLTKEQPPYVSSTSV